MLGDDESDDDSLDNLQHDDDDMDLGSIATARGFGSDAYFKQWKSDTITDTSGRVPPQTLCKLVCAKT